MGSMPLSLTSAHFPPIPDRESRCGVVSPDIWSNRRSVCRDFFEGHSIFEWCDIWFIIDVLIAEEEEGNICFKFFTFLLTIFMVVSINYNIMYPFY